MKKFKKENLEEIINKQMEINGYDVNHTYLIDNPVIEGKDWYEYYTTTPEKEEEMREWLKEYVKPFVSKSRIDKEIGMMLLNYGLKTIDK